MPGTNAFVHPRQTALSHVFVFWHSIGVRLEASAGRLREILYSYLDQFDREAMD
jgi:hypothetical protein